ncbi:MAG: hypothetical protein DRP55_04200, partial [Spirochaetes bacterium]
EKFFNFLGTDAFAILVWIGILIIGTYSLFLIYQPLAGVFIGWYMTETVYSLIEINQRGFRLPW